MHDKQLIRYSDHWSVIYCKLCALVITQQKPMMDGLRHSAAR